MLFITRKKIKVLYSSVFFLLFSIKKNTSKSLIYFIFLAKVIVECVTCTISGMFVSLYEIVVVDIFMSTRLYFFILYYHH
jgi:hypothetical protein